MIQVPTVPLDSVPLAERGAVEHLNDALRDLAHFVEQFASALDLYDYSRSLTFGARGAHSWMFIAGRDGAMAIYHFGMAMKGIRTSLGKQCPTLLDLADRTKLRSAKKSLKDMVPNFEDVRHAVAHAGEVMNDRDTSDRHSISIPERLVKKLIYRNCFDSNGKFRNTYNGKLQEYELSSQTLAELNRILQEFYSAFSAIKPPEARTAQSAP
jgi:hypothetical protein